MIQFLLGVFLSFFAVIALVVWHLSIIKETYRKSVVTDYLRESQAWEREIMRGVLGAYTGVIEKQKTLIDQHIEATPLLGQTRAALPQNTETHAHTHTHTHDKLVFLARLGYSWEKRRAKDNDDYDTVTMLGPGGEFIFEAFGYEFLNLPPEGLEVQSGLFIKTCASCGGVYPAKNKNSQTCGDKCRTKKSKL